MAVAASEFAELNDRVFTETGVLGGDGADIGYTATATMEIAPDAGVPYTGGYDVYEGTMAGIAEDLGSAAWNDAALYALGAPFEDSGLGVQSGLLNTTSYDVIAYSFTSPVPTGESFTLLDPGVSYPEYSGAITYTVSATYNGSPVSTAGWTFTVETPTGGALGSAIAINAAAGTITASAYSGATWPDSVVVITPNAPVTSISISANTIPYDFWALLLPHISSALLFESVNSAPTTAGFYAIWQVNGASITGGGALGQPGPAWTYVGSGDFQDNGATDMLFRNENGALVYWEVEGTTILGAFTIGNPGGTWNVAGLGDFNGDGHTDILFSDASGDLAIWEIDGSAIVAGGVIGNPGPAWTIKSVGNFNGGTTSDILFENSSGVYAYWLMNGLSVAGSLIQPTGPAGDVYAGIGDFDGDGRNDVLFENPATGRLDAWLMSGGGGVWGTVNLTTLPLGNKIASVGYYTAATDTDVVVSNTFTGALSDYVFANAQLTSSSVLGSAGSQYAVSTPPYALAPPAPPTVMFTDAAGDIATWDVRYGTIQSGAEYMAPGSGFQLLAGGDLDGYGGADMLFANGSGEFAYWAIDDGQVTGGGALGYEPAGYAFKGLGDFNGDGIEDLLFVNAAGDDLAWILDGTNILAEVNLGSPGAGYTLAGIGDLTGDGTSDLIFETAGGEFVAWFIADGANVGVQQIGAPGSGWGLVGTGDFDGNGRSDLLFENGAGNFLIWEMNGASVVAKGTVTGPGSGWNYLGVAEIEGNDCASIFFVNASTGQVLAENMNGVTGVSYATLGAAGGGFNPVLVV